MFYYSVSDGSYTIALDMIVLQLLIEWLLLELRCGSLFYNCALDVCYKSTTALQVVVSFVKLRNLLLK